MHPADTDTATTKTDPTTKVVKFFKSEGVELYLGAYEAALIANLTPRLVNIRAELAKLMGVSHFEAEARLKQMMEEAAELQLDRVHDIFNAVGCPEDEDARRSRRAT